MNINKHKKIAVLLITPLFVLAPLQTLAEGLYAGVQYAFLKYERDGFDNAEPTALNIRGGLEINDYFAFEARLGFGANGDKANGTDVEVDTLAGVYAKAGIMASAPISPYLIGGWTYVNLNEDDHDLSYGGGVEIRTNENLSVNLEYMDIINNFDNAADITAVHLGLTYKF